MIYLVNLIMLQNLLIMTITCSSKAWHLSGTELLRSASVAWATATLRSMLSVWPGSGTRGVVISDVTWSNSSSRKQEPPAQNSHSIWLVVVVVVVVVGSGVMVQLGVVEPLNTTLSSSQHCSRDSHWRMLVGVGV